MKKTFLSIALVTTLTLSTMGVQAYTQPVSAQSNVINVLDKKVINQINVENIYNTIDYLAKTPRVAATAEEYAAVLYVKQQFENYGYEAEIQPFEYLGYTAPHTVDLEIDGVSLNPLPFTYTTSGDIEADLEYVGLGRTADLVGKDLTGKIALIQRGEISFGDKVLNAANSGAAGVIIFNNAAGVINGTLGGANDRFVPAVSITQAQGQELVSKLTNGEEVSASLKVLGAESGLRTSHNVIANKKASNKNKDNGNVIVLSSHHDSVPGAPGANDNASGTAMVLELARVLKDLPTDTEIRFATFGAEELGLIGSRHYVNTLPQEELNRIVANFNLDMVGSRDAGDLVMRTVNGQPNLVTELTQASSLRLNGSPTPYAQGGSSDHVPFGEAGIPAALFIHSPLEPWYHTPEDTIDKISKEKLQDVAEIVSTAIYDYASFDNQAPKPKKLKKEKVTQQMYFEQDVQ
ncbi:M28 family peptidase [Halalkalibacter akibai]|uniref:Aminopeptidase Y n=1 Tax=Halalkalibacter akibai (strain ATCC 43226 / DSM 21942 / CIP 109018 / JCM 9157 / 1139) TaxID=1236973 RepID=W4QXD3_HALA3|nr:M28 family peptidase [Halalkalibacter akibai]GAE35969.1 aminopeptidase Y [Halalkalibacter akibai JCM 9157]